MKQEVPYLERLRTELVHSIARREARSPDMGREWARRPLLMAGAASLALVAAALSVFLLTRSPERSQPRAVISRGPSGGPGTSLGSCVEPFSRESLAARDFAFDGTITDIAVPEDSELPTEVTFAVERWYKGDGGESVTLKTYERPGTVSSAGGPELAVGARLLASGDDVYLWGCGFSLPYNRANADLFENAFSGN
jgi:hypothetical protein